MALSATELAALAKQVADIILDRFTETNKLAVQNGERITRLERALARIDGAEFHINTSEALINHPRFGQLVGRGFEEMISHASATFRKDAQGWLGKPFLTSHEAAKLMGIHPKQLSAMRARGEGPHWSGKGKLIRYERVEVERWLREMPT